jgi:predicted transcriptional regulator
MIKTRNRNEIIASILEVINRGGSTRIKIMYGAFLSSEQLNDYLVFLLENALISYQEQLQLKKKIKRSPFVITEKGTHFLKIHNQMNEMIPDIIQTK